MTLLIDPMSVTDKPLLLHQQEPGNYQVSVAGLILGRLSRYEVAGGDVRWLWYLTGPHPPEEAAPPYGECRSLVLAKEAMRSFFQTCVERASNSKVAIKWNESMD